MSAVLCRVEDLRSGGQRWLTSDRGTRGVGAGSVKQVRMELPLGNVTVHPSVLATVARLTALAIPGVARLSNTRRPGMGRMLSRLGSWGGVDLNICDGAIAVDLYVVADADASLLRLGQNVQAEVRRAIRELVGMDVLEVNVYIQDVDIPLARAS